MAHVDGTDETQVTQPPDSVRALRIRRQHPQGVAPAPCPPDRRAAFQRDNRMVPSSDGSPDGSGGVDTGEVAASLSVWKRSSRYMMSDHGDGGASDGGRKALAWRLR